MGDVIVPNQEKRRIPTQLEDFEAPMVNTYSLETTIAEKIDAILSLMEFSSRMKDYYDIYYLANKFDFDGNITHINIASIRWISLGNIGIENLFGLFLIRPRGKLGEERNFLKGYFRG